MMGIELVDLRREINIEILFLSPTAPGVGTYVVLKTISGLYAIV